MNLALGRLFKFPQSLGGASMRQLASAPPSLVALCANLNSHPCRFIAVTISNE